MQSEIVGTPVSTRGLAMVSLPPVSAVLDTELRRIIKERGIVVWLDADGSYNGFVDALQRRAATGSFPFPVLRFEGSFLQLMLALEPYGNGLHPEKVLVHLPGFNKNTVADTPVYELYKAGRSFERALDSVIEQAASGLMRPEESTEFRKGKPTLEEADTWLASVRASEKDLFLLGLEQRDPASVLSELFTDGSSLVRDLDSSEHRTQFLEYLCRRVGLPDDEWCRLLSCEPPLQVSALRSVLATWLMAVEFVTDLREPPRTPALLLVQKLPKPLVKLCHDLVERLRQQAPETYRQLSGEFEGTLARDGAHAPDKLGSIDTFRFEEQSIRRAAVDALVRSEFDVALNYAQGRAPEQSFWVRHDKSLERTWKLIRAGATVGKVLTQSTHGLKHVGSLDEATLRYRDTLFKVDQTHRAFEQLFHHQHSTELEDDVALSDARRAVQRAYRDWANALTGDFCNLCEQLGPLPSPDMRQRAIYEQFVQPLIESGHRVAVFMVDAMRFEMAEELRRFFDGKKYKTTLDARLAELPTVTEVGMNALPPTSQGGRLRLVHKDRKILGFRSGDAFNVSIPEHRVKAMGNRSLKGEAIDLTLSEVIARSGVELETILRRKNASRLIVVRSLELDSAGEKGFHLGTFELTLNQLREAVQKLQGAGIGHYVLVADHGFLLQDQTAEQIVYKDAPKRRHVLSPTRSGMPGALEVPLSALDYDSDEEGYLVFRKDTAVWRTQEKLEPFVHGGNSLQERVVPVLCLEKQSKSGGTAAKYEVIAKALPAEGIRRQCLSLQVRLQRRSTGELSFAGPRKISLALRVVGHNALPEIVEVGPPGSFEAGTIHVPPGAEAATVVFGLEGEIDENVRVEVYHPDGTEQVEPATVQGWFAMRRNRRAGSVGGSGECAAVVPDSVAPENRAAQPSEARSSEAQPSGAALAEAQPSRSDTAVHWRGAFDDDGYAKAFERIERQETINEAELAEVLGSPRKVRIFSRHFDDLKKLVPFEVEITVVSGLKTYVKKGNY